MEEWDGKKNILATGIITTIGLGVLLWEHSERNLKEILKKGRDLLTTEGKLVKPCLLKNTEQLKKFLEKHHTPSQEEIRQVKEELQQLVERVAALESTNNSAAFIDTVRTGKVGGEVPPR